MNNIPSSISAKIGRNLYLQKNHPINIINCQIQSFFSCLGFKVLQVTNPYVSVESNFDSLLIPHDHCSRKLTDTYYFNESTVLRTHMTSALAHKAREHSAYVISGDVYRKDAIDSTHYPVFHQMDGFYVCENPEESLRKTLCQLIEHLFPGCNYRLKDDYFPFTINSLEIEVEYNGKWIEVLGGGTVHPQIMKNIGRGDQSAWAFGMGLERLAMLFFQIPDIRLFWSEDERFLNQFESGKIVKFQPFSKYPACIKDIAFWINDNYNVNDFYNIVRESAWEIVEDVKLIDTFKKNRTSHCYRITYRHNSRSLTNEEVDILQQKIRNEVSSKLQVELR